MSRAGFAETSALVAVLEQKSFTRAAKQLCSSTATSALVSAKPALDMAPIHSSEWQHRTFGLFDLIEKLPGVHM